ncbi:hypothetical protein [Nostoc sp.]|uniref:hypothetical protein n=1 Tax=Nostoc sp. TaxID=1180 RepID=UPI002FF8B9DB
MAVPVDCEPSNPKGGSHATCSTWGNPRRSMTRYRFAIALGVSPWEKTAVAPRCSDWRRVSTVQTRLIASLLLTLNS